MINILVRLIKKKKVADASSFQEEFFIDNSFKNGIDVNINKEREKNQKDAPINSRRLRISKIVEYQPTKCRKRDFVVLFSANF